jgi:hypothetical protein
MRVTPIPLTEKQKQFLRRSKGIKAPWSRDGEYSSSMVYQTRENSSPKEREYYAPVRANFVPCKPHGKSGCRLSHEKRLILLEKSLKRAAFFASLGVVV